MGDSLSNDEKESLIPSPSKSEERCTQCTGYYGAVDKPSAGASESEEHITGVNSSLPTDGIQSSPVDETKHGKSKVRPCTFKQRCKPREKRALSGSSENLLGNDRPRKNLKFCRCPNFIQRWFHPPSDTCSGGSGPCTKDEQDKINAGNQLENCLALRQFLPSHEGTSCSTTTCSTCSFSDNFDSGGGSKEQASSLSPPHVNYLPPQILAHIFSFLTLRDLLCTAGLVCKHWQHVSQVSSLWLRINLRDHIDILDEDLIRLCSRHKSVVLLDLSDCSKITDAGLEKSLENCKLLQEMFLIRCSKVTEKGFKALADHCPKMTHLDVSGCTGFTDGALHLISERCPMLQKLRLKQCPLISDASVQIVACNCPKLQVLTFMDNNKITDATLEALGTNSHNLEILCLQKCSVGPSGLSHITKLGLLKKLDLSNLSTLTSESVKDVARHCHLLDTLNLSLSRDVCDDCVSCVARSCKKLTMLFLISCAVTDQGLLSIGDNATALEHLDISWCGQVTGHGATYLSNHCPRLKYLGLIRCEKVSDTVVERLVQDHPNIHYSTFLLDSQRLIDKAREQGFVMSD